MIGRGPRRVDPEEGAVAAFRVAVEQDLLGAVLAGLPAEQWLLPALPMALIVKPGAILDGDARIVLLDAAAHLGDKGVDQAGMGLQMRRRVGILRLQHRPDRSRQRCRIAQDFTPGACAQPRELVAKRYAMDHTLGMARFNRGSTEAWPSGRGR